MNRDMVPVPTAIFWIIVCSLAAFMLGGCAGVALGDTPADAVKWAAEDLATVPEAFRVNQRYLWIHGPGERQAQALAFALNVVSRSEVAVRPALVAGGKLLRVDLAVMAPGAANYAKFRTLWESLVELEPYFYARPVVVQADVQEVPAGPGDDAILFAPLGDAVSQLVPEQPVVQAAAFGPHIKAGASEAAEFLTTATASVCPILRADWFLAKCLTTLDGGRYYDFLGLTAETTQEQYLLSRGASEAQVATLHSDERAALIRSKVTGKPRRVDVFRSAGVRPSTGTGLVAVTHDPFDEDVDDVAFDPLRNLLNAQDRGREIILERANGFHEFTLWTADGKLVASAPDNLATDHLVPPPYTKRLEAALSCIRCHGPEEGWQPFANDVQKLVGGDGFDVFGDLGQPDQSDTLRRLAGLYSGDLSQPLRLGRNSYTDAVFAVTRLSVPEVSHAVSELYDRYAYQLVDVNTACAELGLTVEMNSAQLTLAAALPPRAPNEAGVSVEDPGVRALTAGVGLNRKQFELVYTDLALRSAAYVAKQRDGANKPDPMPPPEPEQEVLP